MLLLFNSELMYLYMYLFVFYFLVVFAVRFSNYSETLHTTLRLVFFSFHMNMTDKPRQSTHFSRHSA